MTAPDLPAEKREELAEAIRHGLRDHLAIRVDESEIAADALAPLIAGWLAEAKGEGWDEGWATGMGDAATLSRGEDKPVTPNPHRAVRVDTDPASDHDPDAYFSAEASGQEGE